MLWNQPKYTIANDPNPMMLEPWSAQADMAVCFTLYAIHRAVFEEFNCLVDPCTKTAMRWTRRVEHGGLYRQYSLIAKSRQDARIEISLHGLSFGRAVKDNNLAIMEFRFNERMADDLEFLVEAVAQGANDLQAYLPHPPLTTIPLSYLYFSMRAPYPYLERRLFSVTGCQPPVGTIAARTALTLGMRFETISNDHQTLERHYGRTPEPPVLQVKI